MTPDEIVTQATDRGVQLVRFLYCDNGGVVRGKAAHVDRLDIETGARTPWKELMPSDPTGVGFIRAPHFTHDGESYAYNYTRELSDLYLTSKLK